MKCDFHLHTTCSDGALSPTELIKRASINDVSILAITDHDTVSGIDEAIAAGRDLHIEVIPGIELSTHYNGESIHILGYFKDDSYKNPSFLKELSELKDKRIIRAKKMVQKLKEEFNISISFENVLSRGKEVVARPHIAKEIMASGYDYDMDYIFDNFIGKDCKAYVPTTKLTPIEGIQFIKNFGGIAILAHPVLITNTDLEEFLSFGIDGIEGIYFQNTPEDEKYFLNFAKKHNLLVSAGSDCHGDFEKDLRHGDIGAMSMPKELFHALINKIKY